MPQEYTKEQLWKIYKKLPDDLREAIFSAETADSIYDTCSRNGIEDNRISEVAKFTGNVLLGILLPEDFQATLEKEIKLKKDIAKKIAQEINRFVFFPVKENLAALHTRAAAKGEEEEKSSSTRTESISPAKPVTPVQEKPETKSAATGTRKETTQRQAEKDTYREMIE